MSIKITTKEKKTRELIAETIERIESETEYETIDEVLEEELRTLHAREQIYSMLSPEERVKPETKEWFDNLLWYKFAEYLESSNEHKEEIQAYLYTESYSNEEKVVYLTQEIRKCKKKIVKNAIGREILTNNKVEFFLQLFNDTKGLIVENDAGKEFDFGECDKGKLSEELAVYGAYIDILNVYGPIVPTDPHLKDIVRTDDHYNAIINVLVEEEIIDKDSQKWIITKEHSKKYIGNFIRLLDYKDFYKETITDGIVQSIVKNTFAQTIGIRYSKGGDYSEPELKRVVKKIQERLSKKS